MGEKEFIIKELHEFKKKVEQDFPVKKIIFFGSRAKGRQGRHGDIDLIVVSPKFEKL